MSRSPMAARMWHGHCLTDAWAARYRARHRILLYAMAFAWELAAAKVEIEEDRLLRQASTPGERLSVKQFSEWFRQDHVTRQ